MEGYIPRTLEKVVETVVREFPVVVVIGPRQSGKTTLLQRLYGAQYRIVSLEAPDVRAAAAADPRGFLDLYPAPVVFDEIQATPGLLPYILVKWPKVYFTDTGLLCYLVGLRDPDGALRREMRSTS